MNQHNFDSLAWLCYQLYINRWTKEHRDTYINNLFHFILYQLPLDEWPSQFVTRLESGTVGEVLNTEMFR